MNRLIDKHAVITAIEKKRLQAGKRDLQTEYKLAALQEEIERLPVCDIGKNLDALENYLFEKYCIEGDPQIDQIVKTGNIV